ncbi:MAG TPA: hypothetical protein VGZ22_12065 [Isosphaeraceae bacterium]|jgi:hypothetical protein|nr:hypothetical protein [Isosphaeraceae bacterium]
MLPLLLVVAAALAVPYLLVKLAAWSPSLQPPSNLVRLCERYCETVRRTAGAIKLPWYLIAAAVLLVLIQAPMVIAVLVVAAALLIAFGAAWLYEFRFLITLRDDAFPGSNDKLIWGLLLIVLPPVGVWLFRGYRETRWPETKAAASAVDNELA